MRQKEGFVLRDICGEHVIVGEGIGAIDFGRLVSLNETGAWLWRKAGEMGDFDSEALTKALCEEYDVTPDDARRDVDALLSKWQEIGIAE